MTERVNEEEARAKAEAAYFLGMLDDGHRVLTDEQIARAQKALEDHAAGLTQSWRTSLHVANETEPGLVEDLANNLSFSEHLPEIESDPNQAR